MSEPESHDLMREASPEIIENLISFADKGRRLREWVGMEVATDTNPLKYGHYALRFATDLSAAFAQSAFAINGHFEESWKAQKLISDTWYRDDQKRVNYFTHLMGGDLFTPMSRELLSDIVASAFVEHDGNIQSCTQELHISYGGMLSDDMSSLLSAAFQVDERRVQYMTRALPLTTAESSHHAMSWESFSELSKHYGRTVLAGVLRGHEDAV